MESPTRVLGYACLTTRTRCKPPKSTLRLVAEELRRGFDHTFAMLEQPFAVAADEVDLMLAALLVNRPEIFD